MPTQSAPVVTVSTGQLGGEIADGVCAYRGIPYAASPAGAGRWRAPAPAAPWSGVRDATRFGPDPIQPPRPSKRSRAPGIDEDALTLNVWTPCDGAGGPYPVMVWIEGGSFITGTGASGRVDGAGFARAGVVLVTINYRLSVFGYLAHPLLSAESGHGASGNYGMMDQLAVLRWVRENIAGFGGDPKRVTVFGVSAGSASIALMLTMPSARGLFDQVIMESPGSLRPLARLADSEAAGSVVGTDLAAMRRMPADELLAMNAKISPGVRGLTTPRILRPILDGHVIPREEADAYDDGDFLSMPIMLGNTANEGAWAVGDMPIATVAEYQAYIERNFGDATAEALERYPVRSDADVKLQLAEVFGDTQFTYGGRGLARAISCKQPQTFRYLFKHGPSNHSDDTSYIFGTDDATGPDDLMISDAMMTYWVQFATTGDPNRSGLPTWPRYDPIADNYLEFGESAITSGNHWRTDHLDFIERFFKSRGIRTVAATR
jgi:para-nitrobenzyl esterase